MSDAEGARGKSYGEWQRLTGAALAPYHLGRLTAYTALGAIAGRRGDVVVCFQRRLCLAVGVA
jgi:sulfite exporter TauE/SafE